MQNIKKRIWIIFIVFAALMVIPVCALFYIQIIRGDEFRRMAMQQQTKEFNLAARRGAIYDRNGKALVNSITVYDVSIDPITIAAEQKKKDQAAAEEGTTAIQYAEEISVLLSSVLQMDRTMIDEKLKKNTNYELVKKKISTEQYDAILAAKSEKNLPGILMLETSMREYVYGNLASNLLGFTGADNQGLAGLEGLYDSRLGGVDGTMLSATGGDYGAKLPYEYEQYVDPVPGEGLILTLDEGIQAILESVLKEKTTQYGCEEGGCAIAMDPKTGEILGIACVPDYDLKNPMAEITDPETLALIEAASTDEEKNQIRNSYYYTKRWGNRGWEMTYEPGSVFKMITASIALEEKLITLNDTFSCDSGRTVLGTRIKCWSTGDRHGIQNVAKGLQNSCNSVFMDIGARIGEDMFKEYLAAYGFGRKTNIGFGGEALGLLCADYTAIDLAVSAFGQTNTVTPLQMITAASAVVNGGYLMEPHIVKAFTDENGNIKETIEPKVVRQVISESTSSTMRELLEGVVAYGTGKNASVAGYRVGGKTGTSEKLPREDNKKIASFCGFMPVDDPKVMVLLLLDEPTPGVGGNHTAQGGQIAAPTVGLILKSIGEYLNLPQEADSAKSLAQKSVPQVVGLSVEEARNTLNLGGFSSKIIGAGGTVETQIPPENAMVADGTTIVLYTGDGDAMVTVPDMTGYTMADCRALLENTGLNCERSATGAQSETAVASGQTPAAGSVVPAGTIVSVEFIEYDVH